MTCAPSTLFLVWARLCRGVPIRSLAVLLVLFCGCKSDDGRFDEDDAEVADVGVEEDAQVTDAGAEEDAAVTDQGCREDQPPDDVPSRSPIWYQSERVQFFTPFAVAPLKEPTSDVDVSFRNTFMEATNIYESRGVSTYTRRVHNDNPLQYFIPMDVDRDSEEYRILLERRQALGIWWESNTTVPDIDIYPEERENLVEQFMNRRNSESQQVIGYFWAAADEKLSRSSVYESDIAMEPFKAGFNDPAGDHPLIIDGQVFKKLYSQPTNRMQTGRAGGETFSENVPSRGYFFSHKSNYWTDLVPDRSRELITHGLKGIYFDYRHGAYEGDWHPGMKSYFCEQNDCADPAISFPEEKDWTNPNYIRLLKTHNRAIAESFQNIGSVMNSVDDNSVPVVSISNFIQKLWSFQLDTEFASTLVSPKMEWHQTLKERDRLKRVATIAESSIGSLYFNSPSRHHMFAQKLISDSIDTRPANVWVFNATGYPLTGDGLRNVHKNFRSEQLMFSTLATILVNNNIANFDSRADTKASIEEEDVFDPLFANIVNFSRSINENFIDMKAHASIGIHFSEEAKEHYFNDASVANFSPFEHKKRFMWSKVIAPALAAYEIAINNGLFVKVISDEQIMSDRAKDLDLLLTFSPPTIFSSELEEKMRSMGETVQVHTISDSDINGDNSQLPVSWETTVTDSLRSHRDSAADDFVIGPADPSASLDAINYSLTQKSNQYHYQATGDFSWIYNDCALQRDAYNSDNSVSNRDSLDSCFRNKMDKRTVVPAHRFYLPAQSSEPQEPAKLTRIGETNHEAIVTDISHETDANGRMYYSIPESFYYVSLFLKRACR